MKHKSGINYSFSLYIFKLSCYLTLLDPGYFLIWTLFLFLNFLMLFCHGILLIWYSILIFKSNIAFVYSFHITGVLIYQAMLIISYFILLFFIPLTMEFV